MNKLAEDALRVVQEWLTVIPLKYWRLTIGKLGQTNKANLRILNERRGNIISRFERLVGGVIGLGLRDRWATAEQNRMQLVRFKLGGRYPSWRPGAAGPDGWGPRGRGGWGSSSSSSAADEPIINSIRRLRMHSKLTNGLQMVCRWVCRTPEG